MLYVSIEGKVKYVEQIRITHTALSITSGPPHMINMQYIHPTPVYSIHITTFPTRMSTSPEQVCSSSSSK